MSYEYTVDTEFDHLFKILIIGDAGVGKTAILQRFARDYFANDYVATIGVDFHIRTIDASSKRCKLQVWDTAGQDRFKCVVSSFYRGAHGVMICFDITDSDTFRNVDSWLEEVKRYCPEKTPVFLVGTKADLKQKRTVTEAHIKTYCDAKKLSYIETSSKNNQNIDKCFEDFTKDLIQFTNSLPFSNKPKLGKDELPPGLRKLSIKKESGSGCFGSESCTI